MKLTIHRGSNQIGGCITEYTINGWRLFVDYGEQLSAISLSEKSPEIEGLTYGDISKSALLITHYHSDHVGNITHLPQKLPIYMGYLACEVLATYAEHIGYVNEKYKQLAYRITTVKQFKPGRAFEFGDFRIMPVTLDHSAFDAYAFKIEAKGLKVFHTGDFRTHGFRSSKFWKVINYFIGKIDYIVCEGTNISRSNSEPKTEYNLQKEFKKVFQVNKYNIIYLSSTNIDRIFGIYQAASSVRLPFYVDSYQKRIMDIVIRRKHIWSKVSLYKYHYNKEPKVLKTDYRSNEFYIDDNIALEKGYVLIARANEKFDNLIMNLPGDNKHIYLSMWKGYTDKTRTAYNPALAKSLKSSYQLMHTTGHCDMKSIEKLIEVLLPNAIIPIHTDQPKAFAERFSTQCPVILLNDGESINLIRNSIVK